MPKLELPDSVTTILENTTEELTANAGKTFGDIWFLIFGGISHVADKRRAKYAHDLSIYEQELSSAIAEIPEDKRIEPSLQLTAQALENSKYCIEEEELRQMFTKLISHSLNEDFSGKVHPSFAEIIKQMSILDAKIIQRFKENNRPVIGLPVCQYIVHIPGALSTVPVPEHIFLELPNIDIQLCSQSLSSLSRLGIISVSYTKKLTAPNVYDKFEEHPLFTTFKSETPFGISLAQGIAEPTPLGRSFIDVCVPD